MSKHGLTWIAIFLVVTTMFLKLPPMVAKQDAVLNTYSALVEVDALARQKFVEKIDDDRLVQGAIRGMMRELDPYSGYISPEELPAFERRSKGHYIGIGVEIGMRDDALTIVAPVEGGPATEAGIVAGDRILSIDGVDCEDLSVFDVEDLLTGPRGSYVTLTVQQPHAETARTVTVQRKEVNLITVRGFVRNKDGSWSYWLDREHGIGYIRISNFLGNTSSEFDAALHELLPQNLTGLVLDLRFDPGGVMQEAIAIVDRFVDHGTIVSVVNRRKAVHAYQATSNTPARDVKLALLVNHASASASEIVAGALQDFHRAKIIGGRTFGKGCVQQLIYLTEHQAAISLTTAYYKLPNGRIIHRTPENTDNQEWGIKPDIQVYVDDAELERIQESRRSQEIRGNDGQGKAAARIYRDPQLEAALQYLRERLQ